jgi:hypothetical protein
LTRSARTSIGGRLGRTSSWRRRYRSRRDPPRCLGLAARSARPRYVFGRGQDARARRHIGRRGLGAEADLAQAHAAPEHDRLEFPGWGLWWSKGSDGPFASVAHVFLHPAGRCGAGVCGPLSACWPHPRGRHEQSVPSARSAPGDGGSRSRSGVLLAMPPVHPPRGGWRDGGDSGACHNGTMTGPLERSSSPPVTTSTTRRRADESGAPRGVLARGAWPRTCAGRNPERGERASDERSSPMRRLTEGPVCAVPSARSWPARRQCRPSAGGWR